MTTTYGDVIDMIQSQLQGFVTDPPMYGATAEVMQANALSVKLTLPAQSQPQGLIEIDEELVHVIDFDASTSTATIPPWGRGQNGTTATAHALGAKVSVNPRYPRKRVGQAINATLNAMCPPLFGVAEGELTAQYLQWEYPLPAETRSLLHAEYRPWNSTVYDWRPIRAARIKRDSGVPVLHLPTQAGLVVAEVRYVVATNPIALTTPSQPYTDCGLGESTIDVVCLGAIPRLVTTAELARQQLTSVESSDRAALVPAGSGANAAKFYYAMFQDRLKDEAAGLRQQYPLTVMRNV